MAERQFGPYRLVRQIAVGGMAEIHLAKTKGIAGFEKYVALKMIHPNFAEDDQFIQMLVDEAKIAVQLTHGNIAQTFDLGRVGETYYITMEYVDGADLYKILRRGSEQDLELPLDVCAFVGKEIASALDHAHRKRDNFGKNLGIVHRDVSPQNVLVSFAGEVKLVDFGIAKATMKARQTAVGVIKGKYYYMSPEQAWGEKIDYRSDIFSAGIVLYEMITGQMLYLEEDLHKLLDMARKAEIAPPSKLRKGVPPQLERIVMHALQRDAADRYQSAGDFATDLERFLHAYSPVFTAGKIAQLMRKVIGDPQALPAEPAFESIEFRDGANATHTLTDSDLLKARDELRDENSVIFRVEELARPAPPAERPPPPAARAPQAAPKTTRAADPMPVTPRPAAPSVPSSVPSIGRPTAKLTAPRPRKANEETRQLKSAPPGPNDDQSGLLTPQGQKLSGGQPAAWESGGDTHDTLDSDLDNIGERTMITGPSGGFMMDVAGEDGVDATVITGAPRPESETDTNRAAAEPGDEGEDEDEPTEDVDEDGPTLARESFNFKPRRSRDQNQPPPALAAKIHAPAVSSLRQPRASRRTPPGGVPAQGNVLQQIVGAQTSEPMPVPISRPSEPTHHTDHPTPQPNQFPSATPGMQAPYATDASGLPMTPPTGVPQHQPYAYAQGMPPGQPYPGYPGQHPQGYPPQGYPPQGYPPQYPQPTSPGSLYQFSPYGQPPPQPMTLTGQLRLFEADELPSMYQLGATRRRWFAYIVAAVVAVGVAAGATFFIIRTTRNSTPTVGAIRIESSPPGADIVLNGERLTDRTPYTIRGVTVGTRHELRVELAQYGAYLESIDIPKNGGELRVMALLKPITGKLVINSQPGGAEIWLAGQLKGLTPQTISDLPVGSGMKLELRLKDHQPFIQELTWPKDGKISLDVKLQR